MQLSLNSELQYLNTSGAELALDYQCASEQPTQLLLLINGYQRTRLDFRAFRKKLQKLAPHVATVAFDNRYCGETKVTHDAPFSMDIMAADALAIARVFMNQLNLKKFSVLGISMGGMITQTLAASTQGLIENLFLVSTTCGGVGRTWSSTVKNPELLEYKNTNTNLESTKKNMSRYFADKFLTSSPLLFEMMCKSILKNSNENENNFAATQQFNASVHFDGIAQLNKISAQKIIIFSGEEDKIIPHQNAFYLNKHIPESQLIAYPNVGHLMLIEEPEKFVEDVSSFL